MISKYRVDGPTSVTVWVWSDAAEVWAGPFTMSYLGLDPADTLNSLSGVVDRFLRQSGEFWRTRTAAQLKADAASTVWLRRQIDTYGDN